MNFTSLPTRWNPLGPVLLALFALGTCVAPARAAYETATFSNVSPGEVVTITDAGISINGESGWAGDYNFVNASGILNSSSYLGFCIDIAQDIFSNQTVTWSVTSLADAPTPGTAMGQTNANLIAELWYNDYGRSGPVTATPRRSRSPSGRSSTEAFRIYRSTPPLRPCRTGP